jgi:2-succinyl-5-enolpyruvyl-6-hydroxy-3-cyclohexene-1-carboxylate synthase
MVDEAGVGTWRSLAARAVAEATAHPGGPGPVHLNLAFREPLAGTADRTVGGRRGGGPWHLRIPTPAPPPPDVVAGLAGAGARGVIVAGAGAGDPDAVHRMAGALGWPVLADPRSGCRLPGSATVAAADALLRVEEFAGEVRPEAVVRLGAPWASRVVGEWLAGLDVPQCLVDPHGSWLDPGRSATVSVAGDPTLFATAVADAGPAPAPAGWAASWAGAEEAAQAAFTAVLAGRGLTEPGVARALVELLPAGATLFVSSSMPVRDVEWYGAPRSGLRVLSNRGANGIDGVVSSALGAAVATAGHTVALVGDLAFLHDTNALLIPPGTGNGVDATVVVVDNDGGGIFSFLPQARTLSEARFERLLGTPHGLDLCAVARAHGVAADVLTTVDEVSAAAARRPDGVRVVVARVPGRPVNAAIHDELHRAVAAAVTGRPA